GGGASAPEASTGDAAMDAIAANALDRAGAQLRRTATALEPDRGYPRSTRGDGNWEQRPANQWTSGFFAGTLWYMYQANRNAAWRQLAEKWTRDLEPNKSLISTHDLGFMIF